MSQSVRVLWPDQVALVCRKNDSRVSQKEELKGDDSPYVAYALGFSKENIVWGTIEIKPAVIAQELVGLTHWYECPIYGSYYLTRLIVRPLGGKMFPKGGLCLQVDGEPVVHGLLSTFLPDLEPIDASKPYPWLKTKYLYPACVLAPEGAMGGEQLGFMLPNRSKVEVHLNDLMAEEPVTLEIGLITAYYSTKASEFAKSNVEKA